MADRHKLLTLTFAMMVLLMSACNPGWDDYNLRIAWRPDSTLTGSDSCLQKFYISGNKLGEDIWCTQEARDFMVAEAKIEVILARHEWRSLKELAENLHHAEAARQVHLSTLAPGEAVVWITQGNERVGFLTSTHQDSKADSLITSIRQILQTRRPKRFK